GDREAGRHGNADIRHLREAGAFAAEDVFHLRVAFGVAVAEVVDVFRHRALPRHCISTQLYITRVRSTPAARRGSRLPIGTNSTPVRLTPRFCSAAWSVMSSVVVMCGSRMSSCATNVVLLLMRGM